MAGPLFSSNWYRVAELTPRLRSHARIVRHRYRGQPWYVLEDGANQRFHRFTPQAYLLVGLMDGQRTTQELWETACERLGDDAPTQDDVIHLLGQLHAADVLQCNVSPDAAEVFERYERQQRRRWQQQLFSIFSWRFPLIDPERFLRATMPLVRPLAGWPGLVLWMLIVGPAAVLVAMSWTDLTHDLVGRVLAPQNLLALWLVFPVIKCLHELGHAYATKAFGGEVHDMGVMLLVVTPVPYVDASAASAFRNKWHRALVGAAGMIVEAFVAALAAYVWVAAEPGLLRVIAYNTIVIAGISTVLFNANPLLRFDGYYILADLLEIPNLRQRATTYLGYVAERYIYGRRDAEPPTATAGERVWFVAYAVASFVYRALVVVGIVMFIGDHYFWLAVLFAVLTAIAWIGVPLVKGVRFLLRSPRLRKVRLRALTTTTAAALAIGALVGVLPVPYRSVVEGVVWIPEESYVRAGTEGFVGRVAATPGARVRRGDVLLMLVDSELTAQVKQLAGRVRELESRYAEQRPVDLVKASIILEELRYAQEALGRARERANELTVRALTDGTFVIVVPEDLPGRFVKKGDLLGYVVELDTVTVRTVVPQSSVDLVRERTQAVHVRVAERLEQPVTAIVRRLIPGGTEKLPASALGTEGGGPIPVDPRDQYGTTALQKIFQVDVELPADSHRVNAGGRAYVRFDHGREPLARQWYHQVRQLFLSRFNV